MPVSQQSSNPMLAAAISYATNGFWVFPTHDLSSGKCSCNGTPKCTPGKHPRTANGFKGATRNIDQITQWWTKWPAANIAIDCGRSGVIVVDVDVKGGAQGRATIKWFLDRSPVFADTYLVSTPSGGDHYYFRGRWDGGRNPFGPGVDVQSAGEYVLVPPSMNYRVVRPSNILEFPFEIVPVATGTGAVADQIDLSPEEYKGAERGSIPFGEHRKSIMQLAWHLRQYQGYTVEAAVPILRAYINSAPLDGYQASNTWIDADLHGMLSRLRPHISPKVPEVEPVPLHETLVPALDVLMVQPPMRVNFLPGLVIRGELHVFYGDPGCGKTTIAAYMLAHITKMGHPVLVFINEDRPYDFDLKFLFAGGVVSQLVNQKADVRQLLLPKDNGELEAVIASREWGAIYFDSIGDLKNVDLRMNEADKARMLYGPLSDLAQKYNVSIICTAHTNKQRVLEGAMQIQAKSRVIAKITRPAGPSRDEEEIDILAPDPTTSSISTSEKFSRARRGLQYEFAFETIQSFNPYTKQYDYETDDQGNVTPVMQYVCTGHKKLGYEDRAENKERTLSREELKMIIAEALRGDPEMSTRDMQHRVNAKYNTVVEVMRELKRVNVDSGIIGRDV